MKTLFCFLLTLFSTLASFAQQAPAPKFASKALKAIVSVNTYDKNGDLLHSGTAFYLNKDGEAIADYSIFKDAYKATVIDASGKQADVDCILGADDTYGIVRFRVNTKVSQVLAVAENPEGVGQQLYAIPFTKARLSICGSSTVESTSPIEDKYCYYTLSPKIEEQYTGSPLFNAQGEVIGIVQSPIKEKSYALDIRYANELRIQAFMPKSQTQALSYIHISRDIPNTAEEALVYAYFKSRSAGNDEYLDIMNRFIARFPDNAEGYQRRSVVLSDLARFDEADADLQKYISLSTDKQAAKYNAAQTIFHKNTFQPEVPYEKWSNDVALSYLEGNDSPDAKLLSAQIYSAKKDYDTTIGIYNSLLEVDTLRLPSIYYALSLALEARGDSMSAIIAPIDSAIAMMGTPEPKEAADYELRKGQLLNAAGKYRLAVQCFNQYCYLMNNKVSSAFYYDRSQMEIKGRMYQQAFDDITSAVSMEPRNVMYQVERAGICLRISQLDDCIASCQAALALDPEQYDALRMMGYAYLQKDDKVQAKKFIQQAIDLGDEAAKEILKSFNL